jgi:hypothetical protein
MSETASGSWFYTRQGEQLGPVTFAELQAVARAGELNPRQDMAWMSGMSDWKPAGEIEDLFEKRAEPQVVATPAPVADPYMPPQEREPAGIPGPDAVWPGARRRSFIFMTLLVPNIVMLGLSLAVPLLQQQLGPQITGMATLGILIFVWIVVIGYGLNRLVNLGMSRWWYLGNLVPILNLWVSYRMYVCPAGYAYHKKLDGAGVVLAILYWLMILFAVLMVASVIAIMVGAIGSPEMREQLEEAIRRASQGAN